MVAIPSAGFVAVAMWGGRLAGRRSPSVQGSNGGVARPAGTAVPWLVLLAILGSSELASYLAGGSRVVHPTLSSVLDVIDGTRAVKATLFALWMAAGAYLSWR